MAAIEIKRVSKRFGDYLAVDGLDLSIPEGKIFGLLGSNGAGKTTLINMITGLLLPDSGSIEVLKMNTSKEIEKIREIISLVPQTMSLYENLTIEENLNFFGGLFIQNKSELNVKVKSILSLLSLEEKKDIRISKLSGGYQRRCSIGCAVISSPKILFLDEPSTGIDTHANKVIMDFIKSLKGITIIITTHLIKEAESICDHVVFLDKGKKILEGSPKQIVRENSKNVGEKVTIDFDIDLDFDKVKEYLEKAFSIKEVKSFGRSVSFITSDLGSTIIDVLDSLKQIKTHVINIDISKPDLEDIFNHLMEVRN